MIWWSPAAHIPAGAMTKQPYDATIPIWADDEYSFDPIKFDPMPRAFFDANRKVKQRGRIGILVIHDNVYYSDADLPEAEVCDIYEREVVE
jgi:hypothetical protein